MGVPTELVNRGESAAALTLVTVPPPEGVAQLFFPKRALRKIARRYKPRDNW